jgi:hypothetical protein
MKDYIIIALLVIIVIVMFSRSVSTMSPAPGPAPPNCGSKMINKDLNCADIYPGVYEKDGSITGDRKFCCA